MLAVVRDQDVVTEERPKLGPDFAKGGRSAHIGIGVPVHLGCARRDRAVRPDQRVEPGHDLAGHHAPRSSSGTPRSSIPRSSATSRLTWEQQTKTWRGGGALKLGRCAWWTGGSWD